MNGAGRAKSMATTLRRCCQGRLHARDPGATEGRLLVRAARSWHRRAGFARRFGLPRRRASRRRRAMRRALRRRVARGRRGRARTQPAAASTLSAPSLGRRHGTVRRAARYQDPESMRILRVTASPAPVTMPCRPVAVWRGSLFNSNQQRSVIHQCRSQRARPVVLFAAQWSRHRRLVRVWGMSLASRSLEHTPLLTAPSRLWGSCMTQRARGKCDTQNKTQFVPLAMKNI